MRTIGVIYDSKPVTKPAETTKPAAAEKPKTKPADDKKPAGKK